MLNVLANYYKNIAKMKKAKFLINYKLLIYLLISRVDFSAAALNCYQGQYVLKPLQMSIALHASTLED